MLRTFASTARGSIAWPVMANEWKRYLDVGVTFSETTRKRAEEFVRDLVKAGEVRQERAQKVVDDLVDRSRKNTEELLALVRAELKSQVSTLGIATKDDIKRLENRINQLSKPAAKKAAAKKSAKTTARKRPAAKASGAKKG
jgi:polyhydroxyalkanoate synthesis regulator phasin